MAIDIHDPARASSGDHQQSRQIQWKLLELRVLLQSSLSFQQGFAVGLSWVGLWVCPPMAPSCLPPSRGFLGGSDGKGSACNAGNPGLIPGLGRPPGEENGNPLKYSCLNNPMDRRAWWVTVHEVEKSQTRLSD